MLVSEKFSKNVDEFIDLLKTTKIKDCFNPWIETNKKDNKKDAAEIRCNNLKNFFSTVFTKHITVPFFIECLSVLFYFSMKL